MPEIPDLTDPRYLDEVGWVLYLTGEAATWSRSCRIG